MSNLNERFTQEPRGFSAQYYYDRPPPGGLNTGQPAARSPWILRFPNFGTTSFDQRDFASLRGSTASTSSSSEVTVLEDLRKREQKPTKGVFHRLQDTLKADEGYQSKTATKLKTLLRAHRKDKDDVYHHYLMEPKEKGLKTRTWIIVGGIFCVVLIAIAITVAVVLLNKKKSYRPSQMVLVFDPTDTADTETNVLRARFMHKDKLRSILEELTNRYVCESTEIAYQSYASDTLQFTEFFSDYEAAEAAIGNLLESDGDQAENPQMASALEYSHTKLRGNNVESNYVLLFTADKTLYSDDSEYDEDVHSANQLLEGSKSASSLVVGDASAFRANGNLKASIDGTMSVDDIISQIRAILPLPTVPPHPSTPTTTSTTTRPRISSKPTSSSLESTVLATTEQSTPSSTSKLTTPSTLAGSTPSVSQPTTTKKTTVADTKKPTTPLPTISSTPEVTISDIPEATSSTPEATSSNPQSTASTMTQSTASTTSQITTAPTSQAKTSTTAQATTPSTQRPTKSIPQSTSASTRHSTTTNAPQLTTLLTTPKSSTTPPHQMCTSNCSFADFEFLHRWRHEQSVNGNLRETDIVDDECFIREAYPSNCATHVVIVLDISNTVDTLEERRDEALWVNFCTADDALPFGAGKHIALAAFGDRNSPEIVYNYTDNARNLTYQAQSIYSCAKKNNPVEYHLNQTLEYIKQTYVSDSGTYHIDNPSQIALIVLSSEQNPLYVPDDEEMWGNRNITLITIGITRETVDLRKVARPREASICLTEIQSNQDPYKKLLINTIKWATCTLNSYNETTSPK